MIRNNQGLFMFGEMDTWRLPKIIVLMSDDVQFSWEQESIHFDQFDDMRLDLSGRRFESNQKNLKVSYLSEQ